MHNIGILGGTFNPIHFGHIAMAEIALSYCCLDKVYVMPSGISYLKKDMNVPDGQVRFDICKIAVSNKNNPNIIVSDFEIQKSGNTYTYDTVQNWKKTNPEDNINFIVGADSLFYIENWKFPDLIFENTALICFSRGNQYSQREIEEKADYLRRNYNAVITLINDAIPDISSTAIRQMIINKSNPEDICKYISLDEYMYIKENHLYC